MASLKKVNLSYAWLGLLLLTGAGLLAGQTSTHASWLPVLVAGLIWVKGWVVGRFFLNVDDAHPYVAWAVRIFTAFAPFALLLTESLAH